jgi:hypothetical protein
MAFFQYFQYNVKVVHIWLSRRTLTPLVVYRQVYSYQPPVGCDIFNFVEESILYNYADDNTLSYSDTELNKLVDILEKESLNLIHWFSHNQMKANPDRAKY